MSPAPFRTPRTADQIRNELLAGLGTKHADESLLLELASSSAALAFEIEVAASQLTKVLQNPGTLADAKRAGAVVDVLLDLGRVSSVLVRRVETTLLAASTLRLQRRLHDGARNDF